MPRIAEEIAQSIYNEYSALFTNNNKPVEIKLTGGMSVVKGKIRGGFLPGDIVLCETKPRLGRATKGEFYLVMKESQEPYIALDVGEEMVSYATNFSLFERPSMMDCTNPIALKSKVLFYNQPYYKEIANPKWAEEPITKAPTGSSINTIMVTHA